VRQHRREQLIWLLVTVFVTCGALAERVSVGWDSAASFAGYTTYAWETGTPVQNPFVHRRITDAIDRQLVEKGFQKIDVDQNPDLIVVYWTAATETPLNSMHPGEGWRWVGMDSMTVENIAAGQLLVQIGDARTKRLLWMGTASSTVSGNIDQSIHSIDSDVAQMFRMFPPPKKRK